MAQNSQISQNDAQAPKSVSLLGCGWLGIALAPALQSRGLFVRGSTTRSSKLATLSSLGIEPHLLRIETSDVSASSPANEAKNAFFDSDILFLNTPPETAFGPDYHLGQLREILSQLSPRTKHVVYISSTSVYGREQGEVDEATPTAPDAGSGEILVASETYLKAEAVARGFALTIVRAAGLIGPGRHPGLFLAGRKNVKDGEGPVNLIHQTDLVEILAALMTSAAPAPNELRTFNAVAPAHPSRKEFYSRVSSALGVEAPEFAAASAQTTQNAKVIRGTKVIDATGVTFTHGDLYSGLGLKK